MLKMKKSNDCNHFSGENLMKNVLFAETAADSADFRVDFFPMQGILPEQTDRFNPT